MSTAFEIQSALPSGTSPIVIDVEEGGSSTPVKGAYLDVHTQNGHNNQLWEFEADPATPGYFFIKSLQADNKGETQYIDIHGVADAKEMTDGARLDAYTKDSGFHQNQLWTVGLNPEAKPNLSTPPVAQPSQIVIESYLTNASGVPYVIDIQGWQPGHSVTNGTALDAFHRKATGNANQLWALLPNGPVQTSPKIISITSDYNFNTPTDSTITVSGTGFLPAATIALVGTSSPGVGLTTQGSPILGVTNFDGTFSVSARLVDWTLSAEVVTFYVAVTYNLVFDPNPTATAHAQWNGVDVSGFSNG